MATIKYQPSCVAVSKNIVSIGTNHGRVWMCYIDRNKLIRP